MSDHPLSRGQGTQRSAETEKSLPQWPCLLPSTAVAVTPLRNLTGDPEQQVLVEAFTDRVVTDLFWHCRGFSFAWLPREPRWAANLAPANPPELKYVVSGSVAHQAPREDRLAAKPEWAAASRVLPPPRRRSFPIANHILSVVVCQRRALPCRRFDEHRGFGGLGRASLGRISAAVLKPMRPPLRDRKFADSSLEGDGFEPLVPLL